MSTYYSLLVVPNWGADGGPIQDMTDTLDVTSLPSISIAAERADVPLTAATSDLSLTVSNADGRWDRIFDVARIIGTLPPTEGQVVRAPVAHYGKVLLCRKAIHLSLWHVLFFGYIDPISPRFNRSDKTCTFTAYAPGKVLELGNAERVHRFHALCPARPFLVDGRLSHPEAPGGDPNGTADLTWWKALGIASYGVYPGDMFKAVHPVVWEPDVPTIEYDSTIFTITQVVPSGQDVYFQTKESSGLILGTGPLPGAIMEYQNPWYHSRKWEDLVRDLVGETNEALVQLGVGDALTVELDNLPLLPVGSIIFSEPINMSDALPPFSGVAYQKHSGTRYLLYSRDITDLVGELRGKSDILGANDLPGEPVTVPTFLPPGVAGDWGPDWSKPEHILSPTPILGSKASDAESDTNFDYAFCGKDVHAFSTAEDSTKNTFDSIHWTRTPASYLVSGEPKRFYRIHCQGRYRPPTKTQPSAFRKGIIIKVLTTSDQGSTWTVSSSTSAIVNYPDDSDSAPNVGRWAVRPDLKVFQLLNGQILYCWTNPMLSACYAKTGPDQAQASSFFFAPPTSFITPNSIGCPIGSSGFVTEGPDSNTVWFFADRADGGAVDLFYWNGSAMLQGSLVDFPDLRGCDFINAITDTLNSRSLLYVMQGKTLLVIAYSWDSAGTMTCTDWQAITLDQANYDQAQELQVAANLGSEEVPGALAWLTGPVEQANAGEPDYTAASASAIVATINQILIISNAAVNIVDIADFEGLSCAAAISELILLRGYQVLTEADQDFIADPNAYSPVAVVRFKQRLIPFPPVLDLVEATEAMDLGTWLEAYSSVQVQNSKHKIAPVGSDATLKTLEGVTFTISAPRNSRSVALVLDNPFITTPSFAKLLANLYAQEFAVPRPDGTVIVKDPYSLGLNKVLKPCDWVKHLVLPMDELLPGGVVQTRDARVLSVDYMLDHGLTTLRVA